jgi:two-component system OmpR family sensor kinase
LSLTGKIIPKSLRARLILSFGVLIFLSLFLAGTTTVYLLKKEQEKTARERVGRLAEPIALRSAILEANGETPAQIQDTLEEEYNVRILLVDRDATVVGDTGRTLRGQTISELQNQGLPARPLPDRYRVQRVQRGPENLLLFFTSPQGVVAAVPGVGGVLVPRYQAVVAVPESDVSQAWRELLPRLGLAGGIALVGGVFAASVLANSISRPLKRITAASEEMALGRYDQQIPTGGSEEVGRLAQAFNDMARQVGRSHRTLLEFLANVSHELKTPLTSIQGFSQAMVDGTVHTEDDFVEAGRIINDEAVRMRGLVDDLLYLSQVEAGEVVMHPESLDAGALMEATKARFGRRAIQADVTLVLEAQPAPAIEADPRRIEQAVANLVDNAIRHTPAGGSVTMKTASVNGTVRFAVHNTGSVIAAAVLPRIFDRFFQVDREKTRVDGNTGLGLAITREIAEAHGGYVDVRSSAEEGTEFVISLPIESKTRDAGRPPSSSAEN